MTLKDLFLVVLFLMELNYSKTFCLIIPLRFFLRIPVTWILLILMLHSQWLSWLTIHIYIHIHTHICVRVRARTHTHIYSLYISGALLISPLLLAFPKNSYWFLSSCFSFVIGHSGLSLWVSHLLLWLCAVLRLSASSQLSYINTV